MNVILDKHTEKINQLITNLCFESKINFFGFVWERAEKEKEIKDYVEAFDYVEFIDIVDYRNTMFDTRIGNLKDIFNIQFLDNLDNNCFLIIDNNYFIEYQSIRKDYNFYRPYSSLIKGNIIDIKIVKIKFIEYSYDD